MQGRGADRSRYPWGVKIWLLRHAEAEDFSPTGRDADRSLTEAGKKRARHVGRAIARLEPSFDLLLVSPYLRARQTAEAVVAACGFRGEPLVTRALVPPADPVEVLRELAGHGAESALLVGHQPHLGLLAGRLLLGRPGFEMPLRKATVVLFEAAPDPASRGAELLLLLPGRSAERLAG